MNHDPEIEEELSPWMIFWIIMLLFANGYWWDALKVNWMCIKTVVKELISRSGVHES